MTKSIVLFFLTLIYCTINSINAEIAPYIITLFIRPLPSGYKQDKSNGVKKFTSPHDILDNVIHKQLNLNNLHSGIYASYAGFVDRSDQNGELRFPKKVTSDKLHLLITEDIKAVLVDPIRRKTISGFVIDPNVESRYYLLSREKDPETDLTSWNIKEEKLMPGKKLPYDTITIFSNPNDIIVPLGNIVTTDSQNLVLPDIYVDKDLNSTLNALRFLKIRHFFAPIKTVYNFKPDIYQERINH